MKILIFSILLTFGCSIIQGAFCEGLNEKWQRRMNEMEMKWEKHQRELGRKKQDFYPETSKSIFSLKNSLGEDILEHIPRVQPGPFTPQTSLIINAVGLDITPLLMVKVVGISNHKVYSAVLLDPGLLSKKGALGWAGSIKKAMANPRSGLNPLVAKAIKADMSKGLTLWIDDGAFTLEQKSKIKSFFRKCAVVVVL